MKNTKKVLYILTLILLFAGSGCVNHQESGAPESNKVLLELFSLAENYHKPVVRAGSADETNIGSPPWVLVFQGGDDYAVFSEAQQSFVLGAKTYVALTANPSPCRVLIIANPPAVFRNAGGAEHTFDQEGLEALFAGKTLSYAAANLITSPLLAIPQPRVPYTPGMFLPMSAVLDVNSIDNNTVINSTGTSGASELMLSRIVAKTVVDATAAGPAFTLLGATATGAARSGALVQLGGVIKNNTDNLTDYISSAGDGVTGIAAAVGNTTAPNPIYLYESAEIPTSLIIKGTYNGTEGYYRLAFQSEGVRIDVKRNHSYTFIVNSVTGVGYATFDEALTRPPSNIIFTLLVTDQSTDIKDNGQYYLGVTNSQTIIYNDQVEQNNIRIATVTTNAPVDITNRAITVTGAGMNLITPSINVNGGVVATEVYVNLTPAFSSGTVELRLGNLVKTINVVRRYKLGFNMSITQFPSNYVSAEVAPGAYWLSFSTSNDPSTGSTIAHNNSGAANMYMFTQTNLQASERTGEAYLSPANEEGRALLHVTQAVLGSLNPLELGYVGTFHRWNQTGERVIRIPYDATGTTPTNGAWTATVIGGNFIILDTQLAGRTQPLSGDAESFQVSGNTLSVSGNATGAAAPIYFRVGLTGTLNSPSSQPRYGLILLQYNNNTKRAEIWVRQGEAPDYLMRVGDNTSAATGLTVPRSLAARLSPYNLTDPQKVVGAAPVDRGTRGYTFTDYPSQAGYYFQWYQTRSWDPATPSVTWDDPALTGFWDTAWESCPPGYRRPNDGNNTAYVTRPSANDSEIRQSLFLNPQDELTSDVSNSTWGYYADGFFDRRVTYPNFVAGSGADIAYPGRVFFNPYNNASLFIPSTGYRFAGSNGGFYFNGYYSFNWSTTSYNTNSVWGMIGTGNASNFNWYNKPTSFTIRCIAE